MAAPWSQRQRNEEICDVENGVRIAFLLGFQLRETSIFHYNNSNIAQMTSHVKLQCDYYNRGHLDNEYQSQFRM